MDFKVVRLFVVLLMSLILMGVLIPVVYALLGEAWAKEFAVSVHHALYPYKILMNVVVAILLIICGLMLYKPYTFFLGNVSKESKNLILIICLAISMLLNLIITVYV